MSKAAYTPLEVYKILPQSNCGKCRLPSCLAFAAAIVAGSKQLQECPDLDPTTAAGFSARYRQPGLKEENQAEFLDRLQAKMALVDLAAVAPLIGATVKGESIVINSLGKDFVLDRRGRMTSECHIIPWVLAPLLSCITHQSHAEISGSWISFREIPGGIEWQGLFSSRCEEPLRRLADANPELLTDLIGLFMGKSIAWYEADIALILHPLPKVPLLICYQGPEGDLHSKLTILFDASCSTNLHIKSIYTLCSGLVQMFAKISEHHR
ncbi:DUF3786 domain-containing protein [Thiovibrio frasassiensis]|uniref:DUF3786 domain-containing protein n=1 Tax=Thiovibrio frasassiensis TaxID=2984131 RepID=A0A9X4RMB9_9BACT|nr:DUF3786 domain-containing protein [Thiovibrio frasassiensis]MDG4476946.1 DUF3786 domain-containing protein [Thiovibrio frasassiensis]